MSRKNERFFIDVNEKKFRNLGYRFKFIDKEDYDEDDVWIEPIELGIKQDDIVLPRDREVDYVVGKGRIIVVKDSVWDMSKYWWLDKTYVFCLIVLQIALYIVGFKIFVN